MLSKEEKMTYKKYDLEIPHIGFKIELDFQQHKYFHPSGDLTSSTEDINITRRLNLMCQQVEFENRML